MKREIKYDNSHIITIENGVVSVPAFGDIWMTQYQLADLFGCFVSKINANIRAILKSEVLNENRVCHLHRYESGGGVELYNLEMITALAFRIRSHNAEVFREYIMKKAVTNTTAQPVLIVGNWKSSNISLN